MKAGSSVALSGLASASSAVSLDPVFRPFIEALATWLSGHAIAAGEPWVNAVTSIVVVAAGGFGMWLRIRVLAHLPTSPTQEDPHV